MSCEQIEAWISAYHDGELDSRRRRLVGEHLARCPDCRVLLREWQALERELRAGLTWSDPPETLHARVMREIPERDPAPARAGRAGFWRPRQWLAFALAPAAAAGLLLVQPSTHPATPAVRHRVPTLLAAAPLATRSAPDRTVRNRLQKPAAISGGRGTPGTIPAEKEPRRLQAAPALPTARRRPSPRRDQPETELHRQLRQLRRPRWRYPVAEAFHREWLTRRRHLRDRLASLPAAPAAPTRATHVAPLPRITIVDYVLPQVQPPVAESGTDYVLRPAEPAPAVDSGVAL